MRGLGGMTGMVSEAGNLPAAYGPMGSGAAPDPPVAGYKHLFDGDATVYSDAGTTLAGNGDTVQQWTCSGTTVVSATQADSGKRPVYRTNVVNGHAAIEGDGSDDYLKCPAQWSLPSHGCDIWTVCKVLTSAVGSVFASGGNFGADVILLGGTPNSTTNFNISHMTFTIPINAWFLVRQSAGATTTSLTINADTPTTGDDQYDGASDSMAFCAASTGAGPLNCQIAYQIAYASQLSSDDATALRNYLNTRFGLW